MRPFTFESDVAGGPQAAARARRLVARELSGRVSRSLLADVALLVTELVANGVRHGGADRASLLHLRIDGGPPGLHVEVSNDDALAGAIAPRAPDLDHGGGLGLQIVERIAARWGVRRGPRTTVWFEVPGR